MDHHSSSFTSLSLHSQPAGRGSTAMVVTTAGALRLLPKIERGLGAEHARLGTFRGFGRERARLGIFRGFGTERARLGTFRGFGTERARLGTFIVRSELKP